MNDRVIIRGNTEEGESNRVYFAHPINTYHTAYASDSKDNIRCILGPDIYILDPEIITDERLEACHKEHSDSGNNDFINEMVYIYMPMIRVCKYFAYIPEWLGVTSSGVRFELRYAKQIDREIINLEE